MERQKELERRQKELERIRKEFKRRKEFEERRIEDEKNSLEIIDKETVPLNFFEINELNSEIINNVKNNILYFLNFMKNYENILLICGDYPSYGGSATDCNNLSEFYEKKVRILMKYISIMMMK